MSHLKTQKPLVDNCILFINNCTLIIVHCLLRIANCRLHIANWKLIIAYSTLLIANSTLTTKVKGQSLENLLQLTVAENSELKFLNAEYETQLEKVNQVNQLPNPQLGVGLPVLRPETRLGGQVLMISASQMFPWFGTLKSKEDVVVTMSKAKFERIAALKLELFNTVKKGYYQIDFLNKKADILNEFLGIYKTLESVSLAKVESGQSTTADVLRIQIKIQEIDQELKIITNKKKKFYAQINQVTNQPLETEITITDSVRLTGLVDYNLENYRSKIQANHPLMTKLDYQIEASKQKQIINKNINKPTFGVGIDYSMLNQRTDANPDGNGRDIFIPKVKLSIPIYRKSYIAKNSEEDKYQEAIAYQKETLEDKMISMIVQSKVNYEEALLKKELYKQQIKTTQMAYEILLSNYSSTGKGFDDLLQIENQLLNYKLGLKQETLKGKIAIANIERIIGF